MNKSLDYWKETPGNIPLDMRRNIGMAQLLLPGPELIDIGLPKDEKAKQKVMAMYAEVLKDQLQDLDMFEDFDLDDSDDDFDDEKMEKLLASGADLGDFFNRSDLSPRF